MNDCESAVADTSSASPVRTPRPTTAVPDELRLHWITRVGLAGTGIVLPLVCFSMAAANGNPFKPDWQDGTIKAYAALLVSGSAPGPFLPLLLCCMASMGLLLWRPAHYSQFAPIRFAIYSGVLLATQYCWIVGLMLANNAMELAGLALAAVIGTAILWGFGALSVWCISSENSTIRQNFLVIAALVLTSVVVFMPGILILPLFFATPWALAAYLHMSVRLIRGGTGSRWRFSLARCLGVMTWLGAWFAAWRLSVLLMLIEYMRLPTTRPSRCYVATAAARGHAWFVGARLVPCHDGSPVAVNAQLRHLKVAELMLCCAAPRWHRHVRCIYDAVGPVIAARLSHPLLADAAYLSLKPAEWVARAAAWLLLPAVAVADHDSAMTQADPSSPETLPAVPLK